MKERERLKLLLKKVVRDTENNKFHSAEELVQTLIHEMTNKNEKNLSNMISFDK